MKIPRQSATIYEEGHVRGFDVSIDTYYSGETSRGKDSLGIYGYEELYCYWRGVSNYWVNPVALGSVELVK